jgi:hypothetical protein
MEPNNSPEDAELFGYGVTPVQFFVSRAIPMPPGTPAKPRANRPPLEKPDTTSTETPENGEKDAHSP